MNLEKRNNALRVNTNTVNGPTTDIGITTHGSDLYFAICAVMTVAGFTFIGLAFFKHRRDRIFHYITAAVVFVTAIAYFIMGSNLGFIPITVEFPRTRSVVCGQYREIFYVRYIDWFITTPLMLLDLLLMAGMPWPTVFWVILVNEIMIVTGLVGALVRSRYKWGYYAFGCFALFYIVYQLGWEARRHARPLGQDVSRVFFMCGTLILVLWCLYPIAWSLCEGGNYISPNSEAVFCSILDFLAKPVFGALLLWGHKDIDPARLGLNIRDYEDDPVFYGGTQGPHEKRRAASGTNSTNHAGVSNGTNGATNGTTTGAEYGAANGVNGHNAV